MNRKERKIERAKNSKCIARYRTLHLAIRPMHRVYHLPDNFTLRYLSTRRTHARLDGDAVYEERRFSIPHTMRGWPEDVLLYVARLTGVYNFNTHCTHEYDCCGSWYTRVYNARRVNRRELVICMYHYCNI